MMATSLSVSTSRDEAIQQETNWVRSVEGTNKRLGLGLDLDLDNDLDNDNESKRGYSFAKERELTFGKTAIGME